VRTDHRLANASRQQLSNVLSRAVAMMNDRSVERGRANARDRISNMRERAELVDDQNAMLVVTRHARGNSTLRVATGALCGAMSGNRTRSRQRSAVTHAGKPPLNTNGLESDERG
jgi:hypothetical protein